MTDPETERRKIFSWDRLAALVGLGFAALAMWMQVERGEDISVIMIAFVAIIAVIAFVAFSRPPKRAEKRDD